MRRTTIGTSGNAGKGKSQTGANAPDQVVRVPSGTLIKESGEVLADLTKHNQFYIAAFGGIGGRGNTGGLAKTRSHDVNDESIQGTEGEEFRLELELKVRKHKTFPTQSIQIAPVKHDTWHAHSQLFMNHHPLP